jgi:hypothetical protein
VLEAKAVMLEASMLVMVLLEELMELQVLQVQMVIHQQQTHPQVLQEELPAYNMT